MAASVRWWRTARELVVVTEVEHSTLLVSPLTHLLSCPVLQKFWSCKTCCELSQPSQLLNSCKNKTLQDCRRWEFTEGENKTVSAINLIIHVMFQIYIQQEKSPFISSIPVMARIALSHFQHAVYCCPSQPINIGFGAEPQRIAQRYILTVL